MYEIMLALYDIGFDGPIRPDHGRMIWGETGNQVTDYMTVRLEQPISMD